MRMRASRLAAITPLAALLIAGPGLATNQKKTNLSDQPATALVSGVDQATLAYRLADHARATKDARAMIVAAHMLDSVPTKPLANKGKLSGKGGTTPPPVSAKASGGGAVELYAEARQLAHGDPDLLALIDAAQAEASKGIMLPAMYNGSQYIPGQMVWTVSFKARGGEPLVVGARRDAATPTTLKLYDENGYLMCRDISGNDTMYCRVHPIWTGPVSLQITNLGSRGTNVTVVTN